jgi:two-component system sensor histidine kinase TctE
MRILIAEDDASFADVPSCALRRSSYLVDWAKDGRQANSWLASEAYDLAILDLGLPGLEGGEVLLTDKYDQIFFRAMTDDGRHIAGDVELPEPPGALPEDGRLYYDATMRGKPVRIAALFVQREGVELSIPAAEALIKRGRLAREILLGMLLSEMGRVVATLIFLWVVIRTGLRPLEDSRPQLARRSPGDLRPIIAQGLTEEIQPVVDKMNQLLQQLLQLLNDSLLAQRHFVSDAADQLRTPIAALQTQVEVGLRDTAREQRPQLVQIRGAARAGSWFAASAAGSAGQPDR